MLAPGKAKCVTLQVSRPLHNAAPLKRAKTQMNSTLQDDDDNDDDDNVEVIQDVPIKQDAVKATLTCAICQSIFHRPVSLISCMHSFCGGCYGPWRRKSDDCPTCQAPVEAIRVHHQLKSAAEAYLQDHPEEERAADDLKELDAEFEKIKALLSAPLKRSQSGRDSEDSDSESGFR